MKIELKNVKVNNELYDELKQYLLTRVGEKIKVNFERINNDVSETKLLLKLLFEAVYDTSSKSPDDIVRIRKEIENIYVNSTTD